MYVPERAIDAAQEAVPYLESYVLAHNERDAIEAVLAGGSAIIQAEALHLAASQMKDPEDAAWLTSWANELDPQ